MFKRYFVIALALLVVACGKPVVENDSAVIQAVIEGELNEATYNKAAVNALAESRALMANPGLAEEQLDATVAKIESIIALADKLDVDKSRLSEAELSSTLGSLYVRKAAFHADKPREAGIFTSKGFRYLDRAVTKYPDNITARINRGIVSAKVPEFMHKTEVARDDLQFVSDSPGFDRLAPQLKANVTTMLAEMNRRLVPDAN